MRKTNKRNKEKRRQYKKNPNCHWQGNGCNYLWIKCQRDSSLRDQMAPHGPGPADRATAGHGCWEQEKSLISQSVNQPIGQTANTGHGDPQCGWAIPSTVFTFCPLLVFHSQPFFAQHRPRSSSSPAWSLIRALALLSWGLQLWAKPWAVQSDLTSCPWLLLHYNKQDFTPTLYRMRWRTTWLQSHFLLFMETAGILAGCSFAQ